MMEAPRLLRLEPAHLRVLHPGNHAVQPLRLEFRFALPQDGFDVMLKKRRGRSQPVGKVQCARQEIADRDVEFALWNPLSQKLFHLWRRKLADRVRSAIRET